MKKLLFCLCAMIALGCTENPGIHNIGCGLVNSTERKRTTSAAITVIPVSSGCGITLPARPTSHANSALDTWGMWFAGNCHNIHKLMILSSINCLLILPAVAPTALCYLVYKGVRETFSHVCDFTLKNHSLIFSYNDCSVSVNSKGIKVEIKSVYLLFFLTIMPHKFPILNA